MNIQIHTQGFELTGAIREHATRQLQFHLSRFAGNVVSAEVYLSDINGPKGGPDKKALIRVRIKNRSTVTIERVRSDLYAAMTTAARQTKHAVRRALDKRRSMEKYTLRGNGRLSEARG